MLCKIHSTCICLASMTDLSNYLGVSIKNLYGRFHTIARTCSSHNYILLHQFKLLANYLFLQIDCLSIIMLQNNIVLLH